jgi:hypothetical protein
MPWRYHSLLNHLPVERHLSYFQLLTNAKSFYKPLYTDLHVSIRLLFSGINVQRNVTIGLNNSSMFSFLRDCQTVLHPHHNG